MTTKTAKKTTTRRVGAKTQTEDKAEGKAKKPEFDLTTAIDVEGNDIELDDNGRLTAVPSNWTTDFRPIPRKDFATRALHLEWKLFLFDAESAKRMERREDLVELLEEAKNGPSPAKRKLKKAQRLASQLEALKAELEAQGIEF